MSTPPPYANITGIFTADDKHQKVTLANYDGSARPGQLVVDSDTYQLYIGNADGNLNLVTSGGSGSPGGSTTQIQFNDAGTFGGSAALTFDKTSNVLGVGGNIIPSSNVTYDLGSTSNRFKDIWLANSTIYLGQQTISANASSVILSGNISGNGSNLTNLQASNMVGMPSAQTLLVDPNGSDVTGDGSPNKPFASVQAAHDYAVANISSVAYIAIKLNAGNYSGNITLSRPKTAIVGQSDGVIRTSWISGSITVNMATGSGVLSEDVFALENLIVTSSSNGLVLAGSERYVFFARNVYVFASGSANGLVVTNTGVGGIKVDLLNVFLQCDGSGTALSTLNTYYLNLNASTLDANTGPALSLTTTSGLVSTSRISSTTGSNVVVNTSQFAPGGTVTFGVCTFESTATNGNGIYIASGATVALGGCAFSIPTGTGFAVAGAAGSVLVKSANNNQIAYNTNSATQGTVTVVPMVYL